MSKNSVLTAVKDYTVMTVGILLYVLGWSLFLFPQNLVGGGVTGLASIVQYATKGVIQAGWTYLVVNAILLIIALFTLGRSFGAKTVVAIAVASVGLNIFQEIIPQDIIDILAIQNGKLMSTIMGGILSGLGIGMAMSVGGSTGGTDIIALIINKYRNVSPGRMILLTDTFIILSSLLVPSFTPDGTLVPWTDKITTVVYGFILIVIASTVLDLYLSGSRQSVQLFILSSKHEEIADTFVKVLKRGVTVLDGKGWYTKQNTQVLMVITRKSDLNIMLRTIKSIDPDAFLSVSSVTGVYGKGFETIKSSVKNIEQKDEK